MAKISLSNTTEVYEVRDGLELLQAYRINPQLPFKFGCCKGHCGTCAIKVIDGHNNLSKITKEEIQTLKIHKLDNTTWRLACQCAIYGDIKIDK